VRTDINLVHADQKRGAVEEVDSRYWQAPATREFFTLVHRGAEIT